MDSGAGRYALVHGLDGNLVELAIVRGLPLLPTSEALGRDHRTIKQLSVRGLWEAAGGMSLAAAHQVLVTLDPGTVQRLRVAHPELVLRE